MQGFSPGDAFRVDWGHYRFSICRKSYVWMLTTRDAAGESVTWTQDDTLIRLTTSNPQTGMHTTTSLADCKLVSISEKMSAAGKRLLVSLDTPDKLPVDVYITCGKDEIRITVECTRSRPDAVLEQVDVLGGLGVEGDGEAVLPFDDGLVVPAAGPDGNTSLSAFDDNHSTRPQLFGPWFGLLQGGQSLLVTALSAYANVNVSRDADRLTVHPSFSRDPDARHCDIRIQFPEDASAIGIARKYRELQVTLGGHRTLSQKRRERPDGVSAALSGDYAIETAYQLTGDTSRWEQLEQLGDTIAEHSASIPGKPHVVAAATEWVALGADVWLRPALQQLPDLLASAARVPLWSVIWRDVCVGIVPEPGRAAELRVPRLASPGMVEGETLESCYRGFATDISSDKIVRLSTDGK
jgi:hypothetical protein